MHAFFYCYLRRASCVATRAARGGVSLVLLLICASCSLDRSPSPTAAQAQVDYDLMLGLQASPISFNETVRPVLEQRCVVCHGCFDAPCQLKLTSYEGLDRGANPLKVYDGSRIRAAAPTRLFVDAQSTAEWRGKGFHPVLNEGPDDPESNLEGSVMYRMLRLKQLHPQPRVGMLPDDVDVALDRAQVCTTNEKFPEFARKYPLWGMPYGMPNLSEREYRVLVQWLAQGAPPPPAAAPSAAGVESVAAWEAFLNGASNKERLMSRYLYEHLFVGHLHLAGTPNREFYRLVRSRTPPGQPVDEIPTVRPFDDPGPGPFYYRLVLYFPSVVAKAHVIYELSPTRMARYRELFLGADYAVDELPGYAPEIASNPFRVFLAIPPNARYRFLLDDARFFIEGFIKGPVCRGQVALNVIDDHFWVFFFDPDREIFTSRPEFLNGLIDDLQMPADRGSTLNMLAIWTDYWKRQKRYMAAKQAYFDNMHARDLETAMGFVWDGDGANPNAALTVFRHFDSASVSFGLEGDFPETAWIIDYPLFERIHYLLVAGFDVYGNVGHQLNTRLYMEFLRMEGEDHFLAFLPAAQRKPIRDEWYVGIRSKTAKFFKEPMDWLTVESVIGYETDDVQRELYGHLLRRLGSMAGPPDYLNRCVGACATPGLAPEQQRVHAALRRIAAMRGAILQVVPDVAFLRVVGDDESGTAYTLIHNKGYKNLSSMLEDEDNRDLDDDTLTVLPGLEGSYPNFFFTVRAEEIEAFAERFVAIRNRDDYERFVALYGVRRTNPAFWREADWFQATYLSLEPREAGIFDLNRYRNR